jgi:hypothetical protein
MAGMKPAMTNIGFRISARINILATMARQD